MNLEQLGYKYPDYITCVTCGCVDMDEYPYPFICPKCERVLCTACSQDSTLIDKCSKCYGTFCSHCFKQPGIIDSIEYMYSICMKCSKKKDEIACLNTSYTRAPTRSV
jgi:hypothetical protein